MEKVNLTTRLFFDYIVRLTNQWEQRSIDTKRVFQVSGFLAKNIAQTQPTLAELAHLTNMSTSGLKVKFKAQHGKSVKYFYQKENGLCSRIAETRQENKRSSRTTWL